MHNIPALVSDLLGRPIEVGDTIAYPGRRGSSVFMHVGTVQAVNDDSLSRTSIRVKRTHTSGYGDVGRIVTVTEFDRAVIVDKAIGAAPVEMA